jgi:hypothetical protein
MPCLVGCLALAFPRLALVLVWLFGGNFLAKAIPGFLWLVLGFVFLPLTTLAFAFAVNSFSTHGQVTPFGWLLVGVAVLVDLGLLGSGGRDASRYRAQRAND